MKPITQEEHEAAQRALESIFGGDSIKSQEDIMTTTNTNNATINAATEEMMNKMEGKGMVETIKVTAQDVVDMARERIQGAAESVKVNAGAEYQDFKDQTDEAVTEIKDAMGPVLGYIDGVLGYSEIKDALCRIIYDNLDGAKSKSSFMRMAQKCREEVNSWIEDLQDIDPDANFKEIVALRRLIGEDEDGTIVTQSIFSAFAKGLVWVGKKVTRFVKKHFGTTPDTNIFGGIGASIAKVFGVIGGVAKAVISVGATAVKFVAGYALAIVVKGISLVADLAKYVWSEIKGLGSKLHDKFSKEDEEEDFEYSSIFTEEDDDFED